MRRTPLPVIFSLLALSFAASLAPQEQPTRPPITGIVHVRLWSADPLKSLDFYNKILGLTPREAGCVGLMRPCYIITGSQQIALAEVPSGSHPSLAEIAFATPNIPGMHSYLQAHNIAVSPVTRDFTGAAHFSLQDPQGLPIVFVQRSGLISGRRFATPTEEVSTRLIHGGFVVKDRAAEDRFYKDLLGFRLYWHGGMKDGQTDWVDMQVPDGTDWIEYMLNVSPKADKRELGVMNHIALGVPDIKAAREQLVKNGWKPGEQPQIGRDGKWQLNLYDADDTRVELMEFTPVQKPCCSDYTGPHPGAPPAPQAPPKP